MNTCATAVLGLKPAHGRLIGPEDIPASGDGNVAVVSWSYWSLRFHSDPAIIGKQTFYNDPPKIIIGVAPRAYVGPRVALGQTFDSGVALRSHHAGSFFEAGRNHRFRAAG
jgi:hypothetical protein